MRYTIDNLLKVRKFFGIEKAFYSLFFRIINRFVFFKVFLCLKISSQNVNTNLSEGTGKYKHGILNPDELYEVLANEELEVTESFIKKAIHKGDKCYAIIDDERVASYVWHSDKPTILNEDLMVDFDSGHVYQYKAFTHRDYRGKHLMSAALADGLKEYDRKGCKGGFTIVESDNFASQRAFHRAGYRKIGKVFALRIRGKYMLYFTKHLKEHRLKILPV